MMFGDWFVEFDENGNVTLTHVLDGRVYKFAGAKIDTTEDEMIITTDRLVYVVRGDYLLVSMFEEGGDEDWNDEEDC